MKVCGIIAEFDPFHRGHEYLIREARRRSGCDYVAVVLSHAFVQRGTPGLFSTQDRVRMALAGGADAVFALPVSFACAPADRFAQGAVSILRHLGVVTSIAFGCENAQAGDQLRQAAACIREADPAYETALRRALQTGVSYPAARAQAVSAVTGLSPRLLAEPNNILAIAYMKQMMEGEAPPASVMIQRLGRRSGGMDGFHPSSALRASLLADGVDALAGDLPETSLSIVRDALSSGRLCPPEALTQALFYRLYATSPDVWRQYTTSDEGIENRLEQALRSGPATQEALLARIKTRRYTYASLQRWLSRILLDLPPADDPEEPRYIRILGFRSSARPLIRAVQQRASLPVVTRPAAARDLLADDARAEQLWLLGAGKPGSLFTQSPVQLTV